ncbi:MAG: hypothetical protein MSG64_09980 [Pyrinomonadaceae bacterium MAG19_C2-C3]|nr:hypothetical protein [Pyrinomonadaceae bacterium MAG19_C2-C3]
MSDKVESGKDLIGVFDEQFTRIHIASCLFIETVPPELLYLQPRSSAMLPVYSCGEYVLRSAGKVEQTFGGITANLWDDPFEWTLPETLPRTSDIIDYLNEAEAMRGRGFAVLNTDADLNKEIAVPSGERETLLRLIVDTLRCAAHYQGRAFATLRFLCDAKLPAV